MVQKGCVGRWEHVVPKVTEEKMERKVNVDTRYVMARCIEKKKNLGL